jgi:hypothetical protein
MIAFEVSINGHLVNLAGIGERGSLSTTITWSAHPARESYLYLHVGGMDYTTHEHIRYDCPEIGLGSEVSVRIVEVAEVDEPNERYCTDHETTIADYRRLIRVYDKDLTREEQIQLLQERITELQTLDDE